MIDSHCHLTHIEEIDMEIGEWKSKGVKAVVTSALGIEEAQRSIELKEKYPDFIFVCLGIHPSDIDKFTDEQLEDFIEYIRTNKENIAAVGEVGLDYNWVTDKSRQEKSKEIFRTMIELAHSLRLPLVIHSRNGKDSAISDAIDMLQEHKANRVMMHCFSGNESNLRDALNSGYFISYATNICWTKKHPYLAAKTPIDQMLLETDSPWLDPDSTLEKKALNNRPWKIAKSAEVIAKIKGISAEKILEITAGNARRFFNI